MKLFKSNFSFFRCLLAVASIFFTTSCSDVDETLPPSQDGSNSQRYDDINYAGSDFELANYIENVAIQLRTFKNSNVDATDQKMDQFVNNALLDAIPSSTKIGARVNNLSLTSRLNSYELALYNSNKAKAILCMSNGLMADTYAKSNYQNFVLHNGNGDAFRHTLWNYGMTIDVGSTFAKKWGDAHEYGSIAIEKTMDLYNNNVGIQLGIANPNTILHSTFISRAKEKVRGGKCLIIKKSSYIWSNSEGAK